SPSSPPSSPSSTPSSPSPPHPHLHPLHKCFCVQVMMQILKDMEFTYRYVTTIIEDAKIYSTHCRMDQSFTSPPPRDFLLEVARQKNQTPLPLIKPYTGPRLPPDRYCLTAPNYRLKSVQKKVTASAGRISVPRLSVGAVSSRPATPTIGSSSVPSVTAKVSTPVSLSAQRFTVQIPTSVQSHAPKTSKSSPHQPVTHRTNHSDMFRAMGEKRSSLWSSWRGADIAVIPPPCGQGRLQETLGSIDSNEASDLPRTA
uniref:TAF9 RNA polymerase II, TATA box binding protein (TBP)-associated factor n=1 Tax=Neogobius melanostomus TaxID=47308 RepID=A0A8C6TQ26_9GOBI